MIHTSESDGLLVIVVPNEDRKDFNTMLQRAFNCWDEATPEMKMFHDIVRHGKPLQDYKRLAGNRT